MEEKIIELLKNYEVNFAYIFGSYVGKNFREDSDIDIAIYGDFSPFEFLEIASELEDITERKVDLINLKKADTNFAFEIIATGKPIYIKDREKHAEYVMYISSMYLTLEEDRKVVIDEIFKRGSVYGKDIK